jgi:hypothetical protein
MLRKPRGATKKFPRNAATIGSVTDKLREGGKVVDVMKELNWEKYIKWV